MLKFSIKSNLSEVRVLSNELFSFCSKHRLSNALAQKLELILVEAVNNVIKHAYQEKQDLPIDIIFEAKPTEIIITIIDQGIATPISTYEDNSTMPEIDELPEGGWGVALIHSLADHVVHTRKDNSNILCIKKSRNE